MRPIADLGTHPDAARAPRISVGTEGVSRLAALFERSAQTRRVAAGETIHSQGDRMAGVLRVVSGCVRCCTYSEDGRRSISNFAGAGELLGFVATGRWPFAAEAVGDVEVAALPCEAFETALSRDPALEREVRILAAAALAERDRRFSRLVRLSAEERLLRFLEEFAAAAPAPAWTRLPMTRADIGDHLGLSLETVSRAFSALKRRGAVEMTGADVYRVRATPAGGLRLVA